MPPDKPKKNKGQRLTAHKAKEAMINIRIAAEEKQKMIDLLNRKGKTWLDLARAGYNLLESED